MTPAADLAAARPALPDVRAFLVRAVCWNVALFGLIRLSWIDRHIVSALIAFQTSLVSWYGATAPANIVVTSSCSGADVMALCVGVTLAYPAAARRRILGAIGGVVLILALNAVRIATLYAAASSPSTLNLLHLYVWPAVLTACAGAYVLLWMRSGDRQTIAVPRHWARYAIAAIAGLVAYGAAVPWVFTSTAMQQVSAWTAATGGAMIAGLGATAHATGSVLYTGRGAFLVTPECLFTPMIPLYFSAVASLAMSRRSRLAWLALAAPLFFALGVARLLVLALPAFVADSPLFIAHGFYQFVAGFVAIVGAAHLALRRESGWHASSRSLVALGGALAVAIVIGPLWQAGLGVSIGAVHRLLPATRALASAADPQGALAILTIYQLGLVAGLWIALTGGRRPARLAGALVVLAGAQLAFVVAAGLFAARFGAAPHALVIRGWALGLPLLLFLNNPRVWVTVGGTHVGDARYRRFWQHTGETFPVLTGAASTAYYLENEQRLILEALPSLDGCKLLKTDLWDEAKNTRILQWAAGQGALVYGIDISEPIVREAREAFGRRPLRPVVSDVRRLPFADRSFDAIYSMGTIEHFAETEGSVVELARTLKPGGRLILGVPNRHDPFLRPLFVALLHRLGLYGYGYEKSYTRRRVRRMLEDAGLEVGLETGILFIPGWLRMLDLWCYTQVRPLARVTGALVQPFVWLDRRMPALRRHGYLLASVGTRPAAGTGELDAARDDSATQTGVEYVIDAFGCDPASLRSLASLRQVFEEVTTALALRPVASPVWHVFPRHAGITGVVLLSESHLTIHTYPESGLAAINLYCCRPSAEWTWDVRLRALLGAQDVVVRILRRG